MKSAPTAMAQSAKSWYLTRSERFAGFAQDLRQTRQPPFRPAFVKLLIQPLGYLIEFQLHRDPVE